MSDSPNLALPLLDQGQAMKHVTHNEALALLDALVQLRVEARGLTAPPSLPPLGARYLVGTPATGGFAGQEGRVAWADEGGWRFLTPRAGYLAYLADEGRLALFDGAAWVPVGAAPTRLDGLERLGIGGPSDPGNPLLAKLNDALFVARAAAEGGTGSLRLKASKENPAGTASFLFQTAYSGRAEFGLMGSDAFGLKVSADGAAWAEALRVTPAGRVSFPAGVEVPFPAIEGGASGRQVLPSGLIAQWGVASHPTVDPVVSFPTPFPNAVFTAQASVAANPGASAFAGASIDALTLTGLTLRPRTVSGGTVGYRAAPVHWLALGR